MARARATRCLTVLQRDSANSVCDVVCVHPAQVGTIDAFYLVAGLPQWFYHGLPPVPAPPALSPEELRRTGENECCTGWPLCGGNPAALEPEQPAGAKDVKLEQGMVALPVPSSEDADSCTRTDRVPCDLELDLAG